MLHAIAHRGPDGEGAHFDGPVALGHKRLAIIDLDTGQQPMCNEDGSIWITFNGEIYNFVELRRELARHHTFRTQSDTEVILHLYEELGERCLERLNGMFAFAIWDSRQQRLFAARDRIGIKPLYWTMTKDELLFASEPKAILASRLVEPRVDRDGLEQYLTFQFCLDDRRVARRRPVPSHVPHVYRRLSRRTAIRRDRVCQSRREQCEGIVPRGVADRSGVRGYHAVAHLHDG